VSVDISTEDRHDLEQFIRGAFKYNTMQRARLAYVVSAILRECGVDTASADDGALVALARALLAK